MALLHVVTAIESAILLADDRTLHHMADAALSEIVLDAIRPTDTMDTHRLPVHIAGAAEDAADAS